MYGGKWSVFRVVWCEKGYEARRPAISILIFDLCWNFVQFWVYRVVFKQSWWTVTHFSYDFVEGYNIVVITDVFYIYESSALTQSNMNNSLPLYTTFLSFNKHSFSNGSICSISFSLLGLNRHLYIFLFIRPK